MSDTPCRHLRTKTLYAPTQEDVASGDTPSEAETARHCWCNKTMTPLGPDDCRVNWESCSRRERPCYSAG